MKVVIYCDDSNGMKPVGACVTAYSIKLNGNISNAKYILYTNQPWKIKQKIPCSKNVFDSIEKPPFDDFWADVPDWNKDKYKKYGRETWNKFFCWINTPCDGEPVAIVDYDILCNGSILETVPPEGKLFSGRRSYNPITKKPNAGCNGGFYIKSKEFDNSGIANIFKQPLYNKEAYEKAEKIWCHTDEMAVAWYLHTQGDSLFYNLDAKFNMPAQWHMKTGNTLEQSDIRLLHFMHWTKPWKGRPENLKWLHRRWDTIRDLMIKNNGNL